MTRKSPQVPLRGDRITKWYGQERLDALAGKVPIAGKKRFDLFFAFFGLERTHGKYQHAIEGRHGGSGFEELGRNGRVRVHVRGALYPWQIGMAPDRAGRRA